jgi:glycosyltransferase involved in cell wall biosynthesis
MDGIEVFYFKNINNYLASKYRITQPKSLKKVLKQHIQEFDVIHLLDIYSISTFWAYKQSRKWKIPLFITTSGVLSEHSQKTKSFVKKLFNVRLRKVLLNAEAVIAQTESEKKDFQKLGIENIDLIKPGIVINDFKNLPSRTIFREKYQLKENDICVLFLGRIDAVKGVKFLIDSMNQIDNPNIYLCIVGSKNEYLTKLLKNIQNDEKKDRIIITGWVSDEEKLEAYSGADIYCLPSLYDCAPNTVLEAGASGLPIITTTTNGLFEIARDGAGVVIEPGYSEPLRNAIIKLASDQNTIRESGNRAKKIIQEDFDWNDKLNELEQLYYSKLE